MDESYYCNFQGLYSIYQKFQEIRDEIMKDDIEIVDELLEHEISNFNHEINDIKSIVTEHKI